ncbi:MAG: DUF3040 domain-containing protein [Trueperella sp.]|nr:DUF3040 domain-containing protein [Trueperella sp.]
MGLSDYEKQMLQQLEEQLTGEDPKLATALAPEDGEHTRTAFSPRHLVIGLIVAVLGLAVAVVGVMSELILVGVAGFVIVFAGFWYVSMGMTKVAAGPVKRQKSARLSFMEKQAQEWLKRQQEGR